MDKQYSSLVKNNRNEQLHFNSMCNDSSLEALVDSGTTGHYITPTTPCTNKQTAPQPIPIKMPNGEIITLSHIELPPQRKLPDKARQAHIFPGLEKPLISIGTLCDNNCIAVFDKKGHNLWKIEEIDSHAGPQRPKHHLIHYQHGGASGVNEGTAHS